jgi:predicted TIM-barrel fold metal-dependent hydrolase
MGVSSEKRSPSSLVPWLQWMEPQYTRRSRQPSRRMAPDRLIWGSDYPHLSFADQVGSVQLFNLLADWAPDGSTRQQILVVNPAALFGF